MMSRAIGIGDARASPIPVARAASSMMNIPTVPAGPLLRIRAAHCTRMATEHQQYSTENQRDAIAEYTAEHGIDIVCTDADVSGARAGRALTVASPRRHSGGVPTDD